MGRCILRFNACQCNPWPTAPSFSCSENGGSFIQDKRLLRFTGFRRAKSISLENYIFISELFDIFMLTFTYGEVKKDIGEILRKLCDMSEAKLIKGTVCSDHVHLYIAIPPKLSVSKFMSYLKGIIHFVRSNRLCLLLSVLSPNRFRSLDKKAVRFAHWVRS